MAKKVEVDIKLLVVAIALIILATVGSAFATYLIFSNNVAMFGRSDPNGSNSRRDIGPTYHVGDFTVNLAGGTPVRYIRTGIVVEVDDRSTISEMERRQPQIRDRIITLLRSRSVSQLNEDNGLESMRYEILESVNSLLLKGEVVDVFFIDLVIQ